MEFNEKNRLEFKDPDGDRLTADVYQKDELLGQASSGFLIVNVGDGRTGFSKSVRMSRAEAREFAKAIRKQVRQR